MRFGGRKAIFKYEWDLREVGVYAKAKLLRHSRWGAVSVIGFTLLKDLPTENSYFPRAIENTSSQQGTCKSSFFAPKHVVRAMSQKLCETAGWFVVSWLSRMQPRVQSRYRVVGVSIVQEVCVFFGWAGDGRAVVEGSIQCLSRSREDASECVFLFVAGSFHRSSSVLYWVQPHKGSGGLVSTS